METLYWISVIGELETIATILMVIVGLITLGFLAYACSDECYEDEERKEAYRHLKCGTIITTIFILLVVFLPTKSELYVIYGVGGTIDYLQNNPTARQLPDKYLKVLDKIADEQLKDKEDKDE